MTALVVQRLIAAVLTAFGVAALGFSALNLAPGDQAESVAIARYGTTGLTAERIEQVRRENHLDLPPARRFQHWLRSAAMGDLGTSMVRGTTVVQEIRPRLWRSVELSGLAVGLSLSIAVPCGVWSAAREGGWFDRICRWAGLFGAAMPAVCIALGLMLVFSLWIPLFPVAGARGARSAVLPVTTLVIANAAWTLKLLRASMLDVLRQPFIRAARARGFPQPVILYRYALKAAAVPVVNLAGTQFLLLIEGSVLVETIFAWPGLGRLLVESALARDYPVILGCAIVFGFACVAVNSAADVLSVWLDPRQAES